MKKIGFILLTLICIHLIAQNIEPDWVQAIKEGRAIQDAKRYYFGIGVGDSFKDSDDDARTEFAKNIEIKIAESIKSKTVEENFQVNEEFSITSEVTTDIILRGIFVLERYYDESRNQYFSLIQIVKEEYNQLLADEIELQKQRKADTLEQTQEINFIEEQLKDEEIRKEETELDYKKRMLELKLEKDEINFGIYEEFLSIQPPRRIISFETACLAPTLFTADFKTTLSPFRADKLDLSVRVGYAEFIMSTFWRNEALIGKDSKIRLQLLPSAGKIIRYSLAGGLICPDFPNEVDNKSIKEMSFSPMITGTLCLPMYYSFATIHISSYQIAFGEQFYYPFDYFGEMISLIGEIKYIIDKDHRDKFGDVMLFQPGVHFQPTKKLGATFSFEENHKFIFTFEWSI
jgi:LPP20 lipoprotein